MRRLAAWDSRSLSAKLAEFLAFPTLIVLLVLREDERAWLRASLRLG